MGRRPKNLGFISAGGGPWYSSKLEMLDIDDRVWVNIPHVGYVGVGYVTDTVKLARDATFDIDGQQKKLSENQNKREFIYIPLIIRNTQNIL